MSGKKDQRRPDLIVPYLEPKINPEPDMSGSLASVLPMMAIFTRNKAFGWAAVLFAIQGWMVETPVSKKKSTPAYFTILMALMSALMAYLPMFFPPVAQRQSKLTSVAEPAAPQPA